MDAVKIEEILKQASRAVEGLPEHLQSKAFEVTVAMLVGDVNQLPSPPSRPAADGARGTPAPLPDGESPDVPDLMRVCRGNPDRYLVFLRDIELTREQGDSANIIERFRKYKQDAPKLPSRDLGNMVAKGLTEQVGKGRDATFLLKRKGRERLAQLDVAASAE
jgi:hypothetical protein